MATHGEVSEQVPEFDDDLLPELSALLGVDAFQLTRRQQEEDHKERMKMKKGFNSHMRSEAKRLKTFETYDTFRSWTPQDMAAAGFYFTGVKLGVQCFCCSLILFGTNLKEVPLESHKKFRPGCDFLLGKDVGNIGKYDIRVKSPEKLRGGKARYQEEEARLESFENWPFYAHGTSPRALSAAGFVFTGKRDTVQCFSCGGCLGNWEEGDDPWKEHAKWFPKCEFLQSKKSSEEIAEYIKSYEGFVHVTGEHFVNSWVRRELPMVSAYCNDSVFANEELRLDTFKDWPHESPGAVEALVRAGLFYTGIKDSVRCFSCGGSMEKWEEGDEPLEDHTRFYPNCLFLQNLKSSAEVIPDLQSHCTPPEATYTTGESNHEDPVAVPSTVADLAQSAAQWCQEAKSLSEQLRGAYTKATFRHMNLPEVCSSLGTDHLLGCDLSMVSKHISRPVQEAVMLPEVLSNLNSVLCVEGETGSGKTTFLKKTAFLWASGCCPLLNRFQLVFYISLGSTRADQGLADIISGQHLEAGRCISEVGLSSIIQQLKHQVLFLLDDYHGMDSLPQAIKTLITRNYLTRTCLLITVHTNRARDIRPYLDTILEIKEFPFYNTISVLRKLFFHNISRLLEFMVYFGMNVGLQGIHKTPLFMAAVCTDWFQNPSNQSFHDVAAFKSYMKYLSLKHKATPEPFKATVSSCGQLALRGLFSSCFEFSSDDLTEAGVDEDDDLTTCLLSKFSAQRLRPVYRFLSPLFQEFHAAMRLTELLGSERQEDQDLGLGYLRQINSPLKAMIAYNNILKYVCSHPSSKAGPKIVSHLLQLVDDKESLENMSENEDYVKLHPETSWMVQVIKGLWQVSPEAFSLFISEHLLSIALNFAYESNTVAACSPFILQFLQGRTLALKVLNLQYFGDHPESLLLLRSIKVAINGNKVPPRAAYSVMEKCFETLQPPTIDEDYASAFEHMKEWEKNVAENDDKMRNFMNDQPQYPPNISAGYWKLSPKPYKIPRLDVAVASMGPADQALLQVLMEVFSASQNIELHLSHSSGFLESIRPALELNKTSVTKCSMSRLELSSAEQELLLGLPALQSLEVSGTSQLPDLLFANLDKFPSLKELSVRLDGIPDVLSIIPGDFPKLQNMDKLSFQTSTESDLSKLVKLIQSSPNLQVFYLKCDFFSNCESLMTVLASCKKLREIEFSGRCFEAMSFVTILPNFVSLKILKLERQQFPDKETSEKFAQALGSLRNLEELFLPTGDGIYQEAKLIVRQCLQLRCLRVLAFHHTLDDDSVMEIAKGATSGGFQKLENLDLSMNHKITEEGYRHFFQALDNLPNLRVLNISRHLPESIQVQATTVKALSQCVSRLPSITILQMLSWLLDEEDMKVINAVKERHPQSKRLTVFWKWILPFSPVIQNCLFLQNLKSSAEVIPDLQSHCTPPEATYTTGESNHEDPVAVPSTVADLAQSAAQWCQEAKSLSEQLRGAYTKATFRHMNLPEVCSSLGTDHLLGCDLSMVSKHISRPVQEAVMLPEVLSNLNSVLCVEGETGSGKTTFLKKTAFLWASGCCPLLNRFQLVFYISLGSTRADQGLADIISGQHLEAGRCISEVGLSSIIQQLKHQVLFLLDDYHGMDSLPQAIKTLITRNYLTRTCLLITVHTNRARDIRPYLDTILEIKEFPFYNTISVLRKLFFHNISRLLEFMVYFGMNVGLQGIHKTPLFMAAVCTDWFQNPSNQSFHDVAAFKSYMKYLSLKHKATPEPFKATVSSCGQLALRGLFSSCFEFSSDDLTEAGVDEDDDLTTYLLSKFSAQRLRPVYRFLSPLFQEFHAAMRLTELLGSERQEDQDLGLGYLRQINSPLKAMIAYNNILKYVCSHPSSKAGPKIVSHLLQLVDDKESLENMSENEDYVKLHPETSWMVQVIKGLWQVSPEAFSLFISEHLLSIALNFAYESNTVAACSPFILQFLQGRTLALKVLNLQYFGDHPESLLLLRSIKVAINGNKVPPRAAYSVMEKCFETLQPPTIDEDYASAFEHMKEWEKNVAENDDKMRNFMNDQPQYPPNISAGYWKLSPKPYKIPRLDVAVASMGPADQALLQVLMEVFSASQNIELHLSHSSGFLESIRPALELNKTSVTKCSMSRLELSSAEQELLLGLPALQSLEVSGTSQLPDLLFANLDKFPSLKELSVRLDGIPDVLSIIPGDFPKLQNMDKLSFQTSTESDLSKLVKLIQSSPNLQVFYLKCDFFSNCESLMTVLASCKKLREIEFSGRCFEAMSFVTILPNFVSLKILKLERQQFPDKETSEKFAQALGSLRNLEELFLPTGDGIHQVAKLIVRQCLQLQCLRVLAFHHTLDDDSVMEIAKGATSGGFQKLENLDLSMNHKITEEGYRHFFQALDNLPNLRVLNISRHLPESIQVQATTVKALSQCVSRLPSITILQMLSWLLDEEDMKVINAVKERHPQSKRLTVFWKWILPFSPVIQK